MGMTMVRFCVDGVGFNLGVSELSCMISYGIGLELWSAMLYSTWGGGGVNCLTPFWLISNC